MFLTDHPEVLTTSPGLLTVLTSWDFDHWVLALLPLGAILYTRGWRRLHREMPARYPAWRLAAFAGGLVTLLVAMASPLDAYGGSLLLVHMTQHLLLMMVAPPLIWVSQPLLPLLRGLPPRLAKRGLGPILTSHSLGRLGRSLTHPIAGWVLFAVVMIVWHLPPLYELGLRSDGWHEVQHACFFNAALLFWWPVVGVWPARRVWPRWAMIPYLLAADIVNTAVSAVFSFAGHVIYPSYESVPRLFGLSALEDQSIAGAIMWVPGSIAFLLPALVLIMQLLDTPAGKPDVRSLKVEA